jgi:hypothetical protein
VHADAPAIGGPQHEVAGLARGVGKVWRVGLLALGCARFLGPAVAWRSTRRIACGLGRTSWPLPRCSSGGRGGGRSGGSAPDCGRLGCTGAILLLRLFWCCGLLLLRLQRTLPMLKNRGLVGLHGHELSKSSQFSR